MSRVGAQVGLLDLLRSFGGNLGVKHARCQKGIAMSARAGVKTVARFISKVVNKIADSVADLIESVGHLIGDGLTWAGKRIPYAGVVLRWLGAVLTSLFDLFAAGAKGVGAVVGGFLSGLVRFFGGIFTADGWGILKGLGDMAAGIVGAAIAVGGKALALIQVIFCIGWPRALEDSELAIIHTVFDESLATYNVRIVDGFAGVFSINNRPFVLGNMIYMKKVTAAAEPEALAHECTHIWQNQHVGAAYTAEALASQFWGVGYKWWIDADAGLEWVDFGREAQGQTVQNMYGDSVSTGVPATGAIFSEPDPAKRTFTFSGTDRKALANDAIDTIRSYTPWRLTAIFS
jgi:hypothetical protein